MPHWNPLHPRWNRPVKRRRTFEWNQLYAHRDITQRYKTYVGLKIHHFNYHLWFLLKAIRHFINNVPCVSSSLFPYLNVFHHFLYHLFFLWWINDFTFCFVCLLFECVCVCEIVEGRLKKSVTSIWASMSPTSFLNSGRIDASSLSVGSAARVEHVDLISRNLRFNVFTRPSVSFFSCFNSSILSLVTASNWDWSAKKMACFPNLSVVRYQ